MKNRIFTCLALAAAALACTKIPEQIQMPAFGPDPVPSPEDGSAYVTVNIPEGSGLAWKAGDVITVETASGTENYTLIPGSSALKGVFRGKPLSGSSFNILLPGPQTSFEAMRATDFSRQTQKADADDSHIRPMIALKGVNTLSGATLSKEWASEKGGEFFRTRVMTVAIQVPSAMKTLSSVTVTSPLKSFGSYTVELPDLDMTALDHKVKAFIQFSWNTPVMSPGNTFNFILTGGGLTATRDVKVDESTAVPSPSLVLDNKDWEGEGIDISGPGTAAAPYKIASADDLVALSERTNGGRDGKYLSAHYRPTLDISLAGIDFKPICQGGTKFSGTYDGDGHKISDLTIHTPTVKSPTAFIAQANGATIRKVSFEHADIDAGYVYSGTVVGYAENTTVSDITVSGQFRQYVSGLQVVKEANEGFSGAIAGWVKNSTFENCVMDGNVTIYGKYSGGLIGVVENSTVRGCRIPKEKTVNIYYHWNGGLFGVVRGASSLVSGCSFEGNLTAVGYIQGGIAGQVEGGRIENCVTGSYASLGCDKYYVGGIAGTLVPVDPITVDHCAMYGTIKGQYAIGGIAGYCGFLSSSLKIDSATKDVTISNCACIGSEITATGNNVGTNLYSITAGILAWSHGGNVLTIKGCYSNPALIQTVSTGNRGALAGILAYQNSSQPALIKDCYSTVTPTNMLNRNDRVTDVSSYPYYGGIYCRSTWASRFEACFCDEAIQLGTGDANATETGCEALATAKLTDGTLLGKLQAAADGTVWVEGTDKLPTVSGLPADPNVKPKAAKRVSVIGDSISTFKGWIPAGYSAHYPATDGTLTLVHETYWYRLIHDYMKSAELDMNIAFSGSTVTNTTPENYVARYGSASNAWYKKDFVTRFIENGGCGRPDIILIHGGTNDWAHNADPLAPGVAIRNDASNIYGGTAPSASIMNGIYDKADAAKTRSEINALPDGTFCEAYVKLLCQIRERYPQCKVVCITGREMKRSAQEFFRVLYEQNPASVGGKLPAEDFYLQ